MYFGVNWLFNPCCLFFFFISCSPFPFLQTGFLLLSPPLPPLPSPCPSSCHILTEFTSDADKNSDNTHYLQQRPPFSYPASPVCSFFTSHHIVSATLPLLASADPEMQQWKWRGNIRLSAATRKHVLSRSVSAHLNSITISPICLHWMFAIAFPVWNRNWVGGIYFVGSALSHAPE